MNNKIKSFGLAIFIALLMLLITSLSAYKEASSNWLLIMLVVLLMGGVGYGLASMFSIEEKSFDIKKEKRKKDEEKFY